MIIIVVIMIMLVVMMMMMHTMTIVVMMLTLCAIALDMLSIPILFCVFLTRVYHILMVMIIMMMTDG